MSPGRSRGAILWVAAALFVTGVLLRAGYGKTLGGELVFSDARDYLACAENLVRGNGFRLEPVTTKRGHIGPVYPLFLAGLRILGVETIQGIYAVQAFFAGGLVLLLYYLGGAVASSCTGLIAAGIGAFYPYFLHWSVSITTEWLGMLCFTGALAVLWSALSRRNTGQYLIAGIVCGLSGLVRPPLYPLIPLFSLGIVLASGIRKGSSWIFSSTFLLGAVLVISPWTLRNFLVFGRIIPVAVGGGVALYQQGVQSGPGTEAEKNAEIRETLQELYYRPSSPAEEREGQEILARRGWALILAHPRGYAKRVFYNFRRFWSFYPGQMSDSPVNRNRWVGLLSYGLLFPFMLWGSARACLNLRRHWLFLVPILYLTVVHSLIFGMIRYRMPLEPILVLLAAWGISDLRSRLASRPMWGRS